MRGFTVLEVLIALVVLSVGLLSAGQMLFVAASSGSLARSKGGAAIAAQNLLESLSALYQQNTSDPDLAFGNHAPRQTRILNPIDNSVLNCYSVAWNISPVPDPRPGKALEARQVSVTVTPVLSGGTTNSKPGMNKILNVSTIFSMRTR
jgi:prepilin-type N-terminal cleavage/methylation domain-containing protein